MAEVLPRRKYAMTERDEARFWAKVAPTNVQGCTLWLGALSARGYGHFKMSGSSLIAHRVSYILAYDSIPAGLVLDHLCRVRHCVNPEHLEPVTSGENTRRGETGKRSAIRQRSKTHCPQGHPYDGENTYWTPAGMRQCRTCRIAFHKRQSERGMAQR